MARQKKPIAAVEQGYLPFWVQVLLALWMVGVLVWFFADPKVQGWLTMMLADLLGRR